MFYKIYFEQSIIQSDFYLFVILSVVHFYAFMHILIFYIHFSNFSNIFRYRTL